MSGDELRLFRKRIPALFFALGLILLTLYVLLMMAVVISLPGSHLPSSYLDLTGGLLVLFAFFTLGRVLWHVFTRQLLVRDPILVATTQGIHVGKLPGLIGEAFISWEEIDRIEVASSFYQTSLSMYPKNRRNYLSQFSLWKRLNMGLLSWPGSMKVLQIWAASPLDTFVQQIQVYYAHEVQEYQIKIES